MDLTGQVHLLLGSPGQAPPTLPASRWVLWALTAEGPVDPCAMATRTRVSPVAPRAERSLVTAVGADDLDGLLRLCDQGGAVRDAARTLAAGCLGSTDVAAAIELTTSVLREADDPGASKVLRRHWPDLHVLAPLAPSVPALIPVSRVGLGILLTDMLLGTGRPVEALAVLQSLPSHPTVGLALAATLLGNGEHDRVLSVTEGVDNGDDVSALTLVARSVAARATQDLSTALDAACAALSDGDRSPGVLAAALEERSHIYSLADQDDAARADLEALAGLAAALGPVEVPPPTALARAGAPASSVEQTRDRARARMRRRITGVGAPGTFGGRHHSTYRDEIAAMFALGQTDAVEELLLGLLDAVEDEVAELGAPLDPTFFLTLADLYHDCGRTEDLAALQDRFAAAEARTDLGSPVAPAAGERTPEPTVAAPAGERSPEPAVATPAAERPPAPTVSTPPPVAASAPPVEAPVVPDPVPAVAGASQPVEGGGTVVISRPPARQRRNAVRDAIDGAAGPAEEEDAPDTPEGALVGAGTPVEAEEETAPAPRPLTAVERAVRGPRVRSL